MFYLISFSIATFLISFLPKLLPQEFSLTLIVSVFLLFLFCLIYNKFIKTLPIKIFLVIFLSFIGLSWGSKSGQTLLNSQLPLSQDKGQFVVIGFINGLVNKQANRLSFNFVINSIENYSEGSSFKPPSLKNLRLSFYGNIGSFPEIDAGEHWQFLVRLRSPRGLDNFSGFDYKAWLIENNVSATGYVVSSTLNRFISDFPCTIFCIIKRYIVVSREQIRSFIFSSHLSERNKAIISALTIGDKSGLVKWWGDLSRLGIVHLLVISGLHIGLVAGLGFLFGLSICRVLILITVNLNNYVSFSHYFPPLCGLFLALSYSLLAGFSLPTQRAMVVVILFMLCKIFYLRLSPYTAFIWALLLIALTQPLAVIGASFWLSFSAVGILLLYFVPRFTLIKNKSQLFLSQLVLFVGMAAPLLLFVGKISWLGIAFNLIAVPFVSFITVPLCLIGAMIFFYSTSLAQLLWGWAGSSINGLWFLVELLPAKWGFYYFPFPTSGLFFGCLILLAVAILLPKGLLSRWILILPFILHLLAHKPRLPLRITVLDVGQGLSVVVESQSKLMIYDVGASYGDSFDMGSAVVSPFVISRGFKQVDKVVVSHGDIDHFGGFNGLAQNLPVKKALLPPGLFAKAFQDDSFNGVKGYCYGSQRWQWAIKNSSAETEWIYFNILSPTLDSTGGAIKDSNNNSCVLLIRWRDISILLPGDIERQAERLLLESYQLPPIDLLVAPHHGSKTSSSPNFVDQSMPAHVVFSAGYRHHFGHPHADVVARYSRFGSELWSTADDGAITFEWDDSGALSILTAKSSRTPFWWR
jgi:competence protein ComEC